MILQLQNSSSDFAIAKYSRDSSMFAYGQGPLIKNPCILHLSNA